MNTIRKKVAFHTLGCKLNYAESSAISRMFPDDRFERVSANSRADIYVINTCTVTGSADRKCRQAVKSIINRAPGAFIAVVGCYAQLDPSSVSAIPGVNLVLGTYEKFDIAGFLSDTVMKQGTEIHSGPLDDSDHFFHAYSIGDRTRSFLKVQDGCDYGCSYCTVPLARGKSRNPPIKSLIGEAQKIAEGGVKEVVITGVNTGDFGRTTGESFPDLLRALSEVPGIERLRISSIEPNLLTDRLTDLAAANPKIMPHFHLPVQSACDKILRGMKRRYTVSDLSERIANILSRIPEAGIGADIITGFPGETDTDFEETYRFLEKTDFSYLHVFPFSPRPGTEAANMPGQVKEAIKEKRSKLLISLSENKQERFNKMNMGRLLDVLFESTVNRGFLTGFTTNYIKVWHPWRGGLAGNVRKVILGETDENGRVHVELI